MSGGWERGMLDCPKLVVDSTTYTGRVIDELCHPDNAGAFMGGVRGQEGEPSGGLGHVRTARQRRHGLHWPQLSGHDHGDAVACGHVFVRTGLAADGNLDMSSASKNFATELPEEIEASIPVIVSFGRTFLNEVIRLSICVGSNGSVSGMLTLAVLTMFLADPNPAPTPIPLPF
jgi:hypothetical protein